MISKRIRIETPSNVGPQLSVSRVNVGTTPSEISEGGTVIVQTDIPGVYLGGADVTTSTGIYIAPGKQFCCTLTNGTKLYAVAEFATQVRVHSLPV